MCLYCYKTYNFVMVSRYLQTSQVCGLCLFCSHKLTFASVSQGPFSTYCHSFSLCSQAMPLLLLSAK